MDKSYCSRLDPKDRSRSSSKSKKVLSDRSQFSDCNDKIQKLSNDYKEKLKKIQIYSEKNNGYQEKINSLKQNISTSTNDIKILEQNIFELKQHSLDIKDANNKILVDNQSIFEEVALLKNELSENNDEIKQINSILKQKILSEKQAAENLDFVSKKMRKKILVQQKEKEKLKAKNLKYIKRIENLKSKLKALNENSVGLFYKLNN